MCSYEYTINSTNKIASITPQNVTKDHELESGSILKTRRKKYLRKNKLKQNTNKNMQPRSLILLGCIIKILNFFMLVKLPLFIIFGKKFFKNLKLLNQSYMQLTLALIFKKKKVTQILVLFEFQ